MMSKNIFFTSDTHFGHGNIIAYCKRPWIREGDYDYNIGRWVSFEVKKERTKENDEAIIERWNSIVGKKDEVWHCGDFAFCKDPKDIDWYLNRLHGRINLILGNHDKANIYRKVRGFGWVSAPRQAKMINAGGFEIYLSHNACRVWDRSHFGSWNLYGHTHGNLPDDPTLLACDVGVDCWDFYPVSLDQLREFMARKNFVPINKRR